MPAKLDSIEDVTDALRNITPQWFAGFFDGEGSIFTSGKAHCYGIRLSVSQHDAALLALIALKFPGCSGPHPNNSRGRLHYKIEWCGRSCIGVLEAIIPYLILKRRQALLAIKLARATREKGKDFNDYYLSEDDILERIKIREEIMILNSQNQGEKCPPA